MSKVPTAAEFLIKNGESDFRLSRSGDNVSDMMIEFAKLHCEAQEKAITKNAKTQESDPMFGEVEVSVNIDSIINAYPLTNIK